MSEKQFAKGIYFNRQDNAPDFVLGNISIYKEQFIEWLQGQPEKVRLSAKKSREGKIYLEVDTYEPKENKTPQNAPKAPETKNDTDPLLF